MPTRIATTFILTVCLLLLGGAVFAQCPTEPIDVSFDDAASGVHGTGTLEITESVAILTLDLEGTCPVQIVAHGEVFPDGRIQISENGVSLIANCEDTSFELTLPDPCDLSGTGGSQPITVTLENNSTGTTTNPNGDDDDDDDDDDNGTGPVVDGQRLGRSSEGGTRPPAKLVGIDVEVNPSVIKIGDIDLIESANTRPRLAKNEIYHVTVTARLVFSDGTVSEDFNHCAENWQCWPIREETNSNRDGSRDGIWTESMRETANLTLPEKPNVEFLSSCEEDEGTKFGPGDSVELRFKVLNADSRKVRVQSKSVPIQVVYIKNPEDAPDKQEIFTQVANLQIERKATGGALASSDGPSSRTVTFSRILE